MNKPLRSALALLALASSAFALSYTGTNDFVRLPDVHGRAVNQHGDVAVSSKGEIYISTMDPNAGVQVYSAEGKHLRNLAGTPNDFHGFVIRRDQGVEYIFGPRLEQQSIVKLTLDGKVVLEIPASAIPDKFKNARPPTKKGANGETVPNPDAGKTFIRLTGIDVAPNGDIYVTDGYASDYIHRFDRTGKYLASFGGKKEPYSFRTLHKIVIDTRFSPARILATDRLNTRLVHLSLDGEFLGVFASDLLLPSALAIQGDNVAVGELKGQVTILDKAGKVVTKFGTSNHPQAGSNKAEPSTWVSGVINAAHGVTFTANGDVLVSEYNLFGRVHRFARQ